MVLAVDYLGEILERHVGDGSRFGLEVEYAYDGPETAGTAGAVREAIPALGSEFLVLYGDTYLRIDYQDVFGTLLRSGLPALMTVLRNEDRLQPSNAVCVGGRVVAYGKTPPPPGARWIDYGLLAFRADVFDGEARPELADVLGDLAARGNLASYEASERFYDIGTPEALAETESFLGRLEGNDPEAPDRD